MAFYNIFSKTKLKPKPVYKPKVIIDIHEKNSLVPSELKKLNCEIEFQHLKVGDYIAGNTLIERKTESDFANSMINKRLQNQLKDLALAENKLIIIEKSKNYLTNIHENAIKGFILSILLHNKIPIIFTKNPKETATFLKLLANKQKTPSESLNPKKYKKTTKEKIQYILEGFAGIGPQNAKKLLTKYKTIKNIINAPLKDLEELIGKKAEVFKILDEKY